MQEDLAIPEHRTSRPCQVPEHLVDPNSPNPPLGLNPSQQVLDCTSQATGGGFKASDNWLIWQLADSAFPTGGFAHSLGLEAAWQQGEVTSKEELADFIRIHLAQTGRSTLPFTNEAFHQTKTFEELDRTCDAFLSNHVANRGSRAQGRAFLLTTAQTFETTVLKEFRTKVRDAKLPCHFGPVFGAVLRLLPISHRECLRLLLFMNLRALLASAVRLGILGPMTSQNLQIRLSEVAEAVALKCASLRVADATQTSPLLDILQGTHDRLYSRLFQT